MSGRLIIAIISTAIEETALALIGLFILPQFDMYMPIPALVALMALWLGFSIFLYQAGSRALRREPVVKLPVIGSKGKVVSPLVPDGLVKIKGELWIAEAPRKKKMDVGTEILVIEQDGLKLIVRKFVPGDLEDTE